MLATRSVVVDGELLGDHSTERGADHVCAFDSGVEHSERVRDQPFQCVWAGRGRRTRDPGGIETGHAEAVRERRDLRVPDRCVIGEATDQQHVRTFAVLYDAQSQRFGSQSPSADQTYAPWAGPLR